MGDWEIPVLAGIEGAWWLVGGLALVAAARFARPLAKTGIKGYLAARDGIDRVTSGARQQAQSLYQEALAEYESGLAPAGGGAETTSGAAAPA